MKTWAMRGTLHLLPADELGLWLGRLRHLPPLPQARVVRAFDITEEQLGWR